MGSSNQNAPDKPEGDLRQALSALRTSQTPAPAERVQEKKKDSGHSPEKKDKPNRQKPTPADQPPQAVDEREALRSALSRLSKKQQASDAKEEGARSEADNQRERPRATPKDDQPADRRPDRPVPSRNERSEQTKSINRTPPSRSAPDEVSTAKARELSRESLEALLHVPYDQDQK